MQIEEKEQLREKRSSLLGGRKRGKTIIRKEVLIGTAILAILFLAFMVPSFWNVAKDNTTSPPEQPNKTPVATPEKIISPPTLTPSPTIMVQSPGNTINNASTPPIDLVIGKIGVPMEKNGFEITVKSVSLSSIHSSVWIVAKNTGDIEKPLKLSPRPVIIDNSGNQYETLIIERSGLNQSELYPKTKREGAIFFDRFREGTKAQKLIIFVNGDRFDFNLDDEKNP
jgi:hypothetical protein